MKTVTLCKGGPKERQAELKDVVIPDLWQIAQLKELEGYSLGKTPAKDLIIEAWHLAHDLKKNLEAIPDVPDANKRAFVKEVIYQVLSGARFEKWYTKGDFAKHITGELTDGEAVPKAKILQDIDTLFLSNVEL